MFENILTNAVKYNNSIPIEILIKSSQEIRKGRNFIKLEFLDNGIGIPDDRKGIIFQRGYEKEKQSKGMGFGLSLVKRIILNYEGEIWVENNVKGDYTKGSNFILLIPEAL